MQPRYFDTHCHLQDSRWGGTMESVLERACAAGVTHFVCCGTQESDWDAVLTIAHHHSYVVPMLGLHPWYLREAQSGWLERLEQRLITNLCGLGECGLDFAVEDVDRDLQETAFRAQLQLACRLNRVVSIHCRRAWESLAKISREMDLPKAGAVIHAFSGSSEMAAELQAIGFQLSFACSLANPNNNRATKAVKAVQEDRLLFETDSPDIPPHMDQSAAPQESSRLNEPANIRLVAQAAAARRGLSESKLSEQVYANSMKQFRSLFR